VEVEAGFSGYKRIYLGKKLSAKLEGKIAYGYELGENYKGNRAKLAEGDRGYYDLITPDKERGVGKAKVGLTIEKANKIGLTFEVEGRKHSNHKEADLSYGLKLKYVF
jgi:outer membrane autotransporter protein